MSAKTKTQLLAEIKVLKKRLAELQVVEDESHRKSDKRFHTLAQTASDTIININSNGNITFWNKAAEKTFGFLANEMIGKPLAQIMPEEFQKAHFEGIKRVVSTGKSRIIGKVVEIIGIKKSGQKFPIELSLATWKTDDSVFFTAIIRDITERKRLEEKMRLDSQMLSNIIDSIVLYKISDGKIVYTNPQFDKLFGYHAGELIGKHFSVLDIPAERKTDEVSKKINESLIKNGKWEGEIQNKKKDGSAFWSHVSISGFTHNEYREVWVAVQQDVSAQKQAQLELTRLSTHDSLTGLYNRAFFDEELNRLEHGRHFPVCIVMADIDGLKKINDTYGHASGDLLLQRAAKVLAKSFRGEDIVARIGGDEFAVLLPNVDSKTANKVLKRLESNIQENNKENNEILLSISYGANIAENGKELIDSLVKADEIMYKVKKNERSMGRK